MIRTWLRCALVALLAFAPVPCSGECSCCAQRDPGAGLPELSGTSGCCRPDYGVQLQRQHCECDNFRVRDRARVERNDTLTICHQLSAMTAVWSCSTPGACTEDGCGQARHDGPNQLAQLGHTEIRLVISSLLL